MCMWVCVYHVFNRFESYLLRTLTEIIILLCVSPLLVSNVLVREMSAHFSTHLPCGAGGFCSWSCHLRHWEGPDDTCSQA